MKKLTLVLFTLLTLVPSSIWAEEVNGILYSINGENATVTGFTDEKKSSSTSITIPTIITIETQNYTVSTIANNAFNGWTTLSNVVFEGTTLPTMDNVQFEGVPQNLVINFNKIQYTHQGTWNNEDSFTVTGVTDNTSDNYEIVDAINDINVTQIGDNAFVGLANKTVTISKYIETISSSAFSNLTNANRLTSITVDGQNEKFFVYNNVLYSHYNQGTEVVIELVTCPVNKSGTNIDDNSDIWKDGITAIGGNAFICHNLNSIAIPATVKHIGENAFYGCSNMTSLVFMGTILPIMENPVFGNVQQNLVITFNNIKYTHQGTWNNKDYFKVTGVTDNTPNSFNIIDVINKINVTEIGDRAFTGLESKTVTISKYIETISSSAFSNLTNGAIDNANRLSGIIVDENNKKYLSHNGVLYSRYNEGTEVVMVTCPVSKSGTDIDDNSDIWKDGIIAIGDNAFICHRALSTITIPATVKTIGESAFNLAGVDASSLNVTFAEGSKLTTIGKAAFQNSTITTLALPEGFKEIGEIAFRYCEKLTTVTFPTSLETLGISAFDGCKNLEHITFSGNKLKTIPNRAFFNCLLSTPFDIPDGVTTIKANAFNVEDFSSNLSHLPSIVRIPSSVSSIDVTAFPYGVTKQYKLNLSFDDTEEWATYYSLDDLELPTGIKAWAIKDFDPNDKTKLITEELHYIHKEEAILLQRTEGAALNDFWCGAPSTENIALDEGRSSNPDIFKGSAAGITNTNFSSIPGDKYVLNGDQFLKANQGSLPAFRCYIVRNNENDPTEYLYFKNDGVKSDHTFLYKEDGKFIQYNVNIGKATLSPTTDGKMKLTITPGAEYYAYYHDKYYNDSTKSDITVRRNVTSVRGRTAAIGLDNTFYHLTPGEDSSQDKRGAIVYTFDPGQATVFEVTVNFHKRKSFSNNDSTSIILETYPDTFDGTEKKPIIHTVKYNGKDIEKDFNDPQNYKVDYLNNINAGTGIVRITGLREYMGTYDKSFNIKKRNIKNVSTIEAIPDTTYTGTEIKPIVVIKDIIEGSSVNIITKNDYKLIYANNINVGQATITIKSKETNYTSQIDINFNIVQKDITKTVKINKIPNVVYTGEPIKPELTIMDGELKVPETDYDAEYINCLYPGKATINITFKGNYKGTATTTFTILEKEYTRTLNIEFDSQSEWTTFFWHENLTLPEGLKAFVVTSFDTKTKKISTESVPFIPKNIGILLQRTNKEATTYEGKTLPANKTLDKSIKPDATVYRGTLTDIELGDVEGIKFVLINDKFVQTGQGTLKANRCYILVKGEIDGLDNIDPDKGLDDCIIQAEGEDDAKAGTASTAIINGGKVCQLTATPAEGYFVTAENITVIRSIDAGKGRAPSIDDSKDVQLTAVNPKANPSMETKYTFPYDANYHYQIVIDFQKRIDISKSEANVTITFDTPNLEYNGKAQKVRNIIVKSGDTTLDSSNYEVSYDDNINAGPSYVVITGQRSFIGTKKKEFIIQQRNINNVTVKEIPDQFYTGSPISPKLDIKDIIEEGGQSIIDESQYDLVFENNTEIGQAKVNIVAKKINYHNTKVVYFNILLKGDVNGDGLVNVTDIVATVSFVMERPLNGFNKAAADLNGDGEINVTDIVKMVSIIMSDNGAASRRAAATSSKLVINKNNIQLRNAEGYTAAQFDIHLSDGQSINNVVLNGSSDHSLYWKMVDANTCRVVVYSMTNAAFRANSDNLFTVFMTGSQNANISNELLIKADGTTGIDAISTEAENGNVYDMNGRQVKTPRKGVYIINGKKVMVK